ncbi:hypothetical protein FHW96_001566 [Novosphingobium sp. SG751A]|uniref:hypothetical protein n=1 Tax=Novosphingobium sp. SG751A TaxID=2587000 RepID=UPI0015544156|nr:hypothetical protein [Novosphingobium sp. SG751A]NOW45411.1 hypothetical protein [Novosphingobium sp. SG751A]
MTNAFTAAIKQAATHINMNEPRRADDDNWPSPADLGGVNDGLASSEGMAAANSADAKAARRDNQTEYDQALKAFHEAWREKTGFAVAVPKQPTVYKPGPKGSYELWKRVLGIYEAKPAMLDMNISKLTKFLAESEPNFVVTRAMLTRSLGKNVARDATRKLAGQGWDITVKPDDTISTIRKKMLAQRAGAAGVEVEVFSGKFQIRGKRVTVNGREYAVLDDGKGGRRIQLGRRSISLDTLKEVCTRED